MLNRFVANWLRQHAQDAVLRGLKPEQKTESELADADPRQVDVTCIFPTAGQAAGLVDRLQDVQVSECHGFVERVGHLDGRWVAIVETQSSQEHLVSIVRDVIRLRQPQWVLSTGFVFSSADHVKPGHLFVANRLVDSSGYSLGINTSFAACRGLHVGPLLTAIETEATTAENGDPIELSKSGISKSDVADSDVVATDVAATDVAATDVAATADSEGSTADPPLAWERQAAVIGETCRVVGPK